MSGLSRDINNSNQKAANMGSISSLGFLAFNTFGGIEEVKDRFGAGRGGSSGGRGTVGPLFPESAN
jgi:hypothetical protein